MRRVLATVTLIPVLIVALAAPVAAHPHGAWDSEKTGTPKGDTISGGKGKDKIRGLAGKDDLMGGKGNDMLIAGPGKDDVRGGNGHDELFGGKGHDKLKGGNGPDILTGGATRHGHAVRDRQRDRLGPTERVDPSDLRPLVSAGPEFLFASGPAARTAAPREPLATRRTPRWPRCRRRTPSAR